MTGEWTAEVAIGRLPGHLTKWIVAANGCWLWQGGRCKENGRPGDTTAMIGGKKRKSAVQRLIWIWLNGEVPPGKRLGYICDGAGQGCVNPNHLAPMTMRERLARSESSLVGQYLRRDHCQHGHPYSPENTYIIPEGHDRAGARLCRTCLRRRNRRTQEKYRDRYRAQARERYANDPRVKKLQRRRQERARQRQRQRRAALDKLIVQQDRDARRDTRSTGWMPVSWDMSLDRSVTDDGLTLAEVPSIASLTASPSAEDAYLASLGETA